MSANPPGTPSPVGSLDGYKFETWFRKNKEDLKLIVTAIAAVGTYFLSSIQPPALNTAISGVAAAVVKFLLDGIDFWLTDQTSS